MNATRLLIVACLCSVGLLVSGCERAYSHDHGASHGTYYDSEPEHVVRRSSVISGRQEKIARASRYGAPSLASDPRVYAPPGSLPSPEEEVWVIVRDRGGAEPHAWGDARQAAGDDEVPGTGSLLTLLPGDTRHVPVPLKHTDVQASIAGYIATVDVTQQFYNPYSEKIEAVYVFPLPENAAIHGFIMQIGERRIRGIIREREEAERVYRKARAQGHVASLLTQQRPNVFTQKVANIEPGRDIDVSIRYSHTLGYDDGSYEFVFPMVVGPRFNPPHSADPIHALPRDGRSTAPADDAAAHYLAPGERSGHDISLAVEIDAGVTLEGVTCESHQTHVTRGPHEHRQTREGGRTRIELAASDSIPNRDFVLRYRVAGDRPKAALLTHHEPGDRDGYFSLMLIPPAELARLDRQPLELVFVIDCSGSMNGRPLEQAKQAVDHALTQLRPEDTFQVIRFSDTASQLGARPVIASGGNIEHARRYVRSLPPGGGTMMIHGIRQALAFEHDPGRLRYVVFLTDGYIGNEAEVLGEMRRLLGESRVFSFGVGESTNRYLMHAMAKLGRGAEAFLPLHADARPVMDAFIERIGHPVMTDVRIDWGGMRVYDVQPVSPPDLFVGRPVVLTGRFREGDDPQPTVRVRGTAGRHEVIVGISPDLVNEAATHPALATIWARQKIAQMMDEAVAERRDPPAGKVKRVALRHGLLSAYTAFVAIDASRRTAGSYGTTVAVPVNVPQGVRYETAVER